MTKGKEMKYSTPRFYEMDGALRAYANRSIVVAGVMGLVALISVAGFLSREDGAADRDSRRKRRPGKCRNA